MSEAVAGQAVQSDALLARSVSDCIDNIVAAIAARLTAKGPMYAPDAEWTRLMACAESLRNAKRELTANAGHQILSEAK